MRLRWRIYRGLRRRDWTRRGAAHYALTGSRTVVEMAYIVHRQRGE